MRSYGQKTSENALFEHHGLEWLFPFSISKTSKNRKAQLEELARKTKVHLPPPKAIPAKPSGAAPVPASSVASSPVPSDASSTASTSGSSNSSTEKISDSNASTSKTVEAPSNTQEDSKTETSKSEDKKSEENTKPEQTTDNKQHSTDFKHVKPQGERRMVVTSRRGVTQETKSDQTSSTGSEPPERKPDLVPEQDKPQKSSDGSCKETLNSDSSKQDSSQEHHEEQKVDAKIVSPTVEHQEAGKRTEQPSCVQPVEANAKPTEPAQGATQAQSSAEQTTQANKPGAAKGWTAAVRPKGPFTIHH